MEEKEFIVLSTKIADGLADKKDIALYNACFNQYQLNNPHWDQMENVEKNDILLTLKQRIDQDIKPVKQAKQTNLWPVLALVASIVLVVGIVVFYKNENEQVISNEVAANEIVPGRFGATLTMTNGEQIALADQREGKLAEELGTTVYKTAGEGIIYESRRGDASYSGNTNTLTTGRGETYKVKLPDGTDVWLNAASSLTYKAGLVESGPREVELMGEAYFEVKKDAGHPFIVKTRLQELEVVGTEFNLSSYPDEAEIKTTLLEGAVKINHDLVLKPNQQSILNASGAKVIAVNAESYADWKDGIFSFEKEDLRSVMRKISRWYNVEVVYPADLDLRRTFSGAIPRNKSIVVVLNALALAERISFSIKGRKIFVKSMSVQR